MIYLAYGKNPGKKVEKVKKEGFKRDSKILSGSAPGSWLSASFSLWRGEIKGKRGWILYESDAQGNPVTAVGTDGEMEDLFEFSWFGFVKEKLKELDGWGE